MFKINITEEINSQSYFRFIDYACSRSDAFMLVTYRYSDNIELMFNKQPSLSLSEDLRLKILKSNEEAKKKIYKNSVIFRKNTEPFLEKIKPYLVKKRSVPTEWPGIKVILDRDTKVDICVYKVCKDIKSYLLEPEGIFNWKYPYFPDDLSFFKEGYCWFTTVAHEEYSCMYTNNKDDIAFLKELDIKFNVTETISDIESLFFESYKV